MVLMGCDDIYRDDFSVIDYAPYLIASAVALGITSLVFYATSRKSRKQQRKAMGTNVDLPVHLVPVPRM